MSISSLPQTVQPAQLTRWDLQGTRILVVDDEADSRELIAFVLEEAGAEVMTTAAAPEVFRQLSHFLPHLLVSDIGMPQVDGYMLIQQLRTLAPEQGGKIPAIALTAYASPTDQQRVLADGFQAHLTKPVEPEVLVQTIAQLLQAPSIALPHCHLSPG